MKTTKPLYLGVLALGIGVILATYPVLLNGQQSTGAAVRIDNDVAIALLG